jgi:hypothetical protein
MDSNGSLNLYAISCIELHLASVLVPPYLAPFSSLQVSVYPDLSKNYAHQVETILFALEWSFFNIKGHPFIGN